MLSLIVLSALSLAEEIDQAKLNALRQYQRERLELSSEVNISGGGSTAYMRGPMMGYGGFGFNSGFVVSDPIYTSRTLRVYQAKEPISTLTFFKLVGDDSQFKQASRQIKYRLRRNIGRTVALVGLGVTVGGWVGASRAQTEFEPYLYSNATLTGFGLFWGRLGSSFRQAKKMRSTNSARQYSKVEVEKHIDAFNDDLRSKLGLTIDDVWTIGVRTAIIGRCRFILNTGVKDHGMSSVSLSYLNVAFDHNVSPPSL